MVHDNRVAEIKGRRNGQQGRGRGGLARANVAQVTTNNIGAVELGEQDKADLEKLSTEDWATHHMTGAVESFISLDDITPCLVLLPNGERVMATKEGIVTLGKLLLKAVLFVPQLNCNFFSLSQLARDKHYILKFIDRLC